MNSQIVITDFNPEHQPGIDLLLERIQEEYPETIYSPGALKMIEVASIPARKYWVVLDKSVVIGTVGIVLLENDNACIKSMLLQKEYRGGNTKIAPALLGAAINYAVEQNVKQIFLGTMIQFKAAQRFYIKYDFKEIPEAYLPGDFKKNPVDKLFYKLALKNGYI